MGRWSPSTCGSDLAGRGGRLPPGAGSLDPAIRLREAGERAELPEDDYALAHVYAATAPPCSSGRARPAIAMLAGARVARRAIALSVAYGPAVD